MKSLNMTTDIATDKVTDMANIATDIATDMAADKAAGAKDIVCHSGGHCLSAQERLEQKGVKPTPNRILVLRALEEASHPLCLSDIEAMSGTLDKSSISRTLSLFLEHDIVHSFEDGRGVLNYELCMESGECDHCDCHLHFYCENCHKSFCMEHIDAQDIRLPEGFYPRSFSFVIKGLCPSCKAKTV